MRQLKQSTGRGPQHLRAEGINTSSHPDRIDVSREGCAQQCAQISRILNPIQDKEKIQLWRDSGQSIQGAQAGNTIGCDCCERSPQHLIGDDPPSRLRTTCSQGRMTLQPGFGRDDFLGRVALPENFLQQVGALKKQQPLGLSPRTGGQGSQPFDEGIASAADQGRGGIQGTIQNAACLRTFRPL
jgi:hypothetical protein